MKIKPNYLLWLGSVAAFVVVSLSLGFGLGFGLQSLSGTTNTNSDKKENENGNENGNGNNSKAGYTVYNNEYTKEQLLNGITINGKTYKAKDKNGELVYVIPAKTELSIPPFTVIDNNFNHGWNTAIKNHDWYYEIKYANIGIVKMGFDMKIWGGYRNTGTDIQLRSGLNSPVKFGEIKLNGNALINLAIVHELQKNIQTDGSVKNSYVPNTETSDSWTWQIFAHQIGTTIHARVGTNSFATSVMDIAGNPRLSGKAYKADGKWPGQGIPRDNGAGDKSWWGDDDTQPSAWVPPNRNKVNHFKIRELVDADGNDVGVQKKLYLNANENANVYRQVPIKGFFYKLRVGAGKVDIPMYKKVKVTLDGKIEVYNDKWNIDKEKNTYTFDSDYELKIEKKS